MTPQSTFMVIAPVLAAREAALENLLAAMNIGPGVVDPANAVFPFGRFERLHFARFIILRDGTLGARAPGHALPHVSLWLAFLGDYDGVGDGVLAEFAAQAGQGLRQIFTHCQGFDPGAALLPWLRAHSVTPAAQYVNWVGRTVAQIREEAALHTALQSYVAREAATFALLPSRTARQRLIEYQRANGPALTPARRTPPGWRARHLANRFGVPLVLLLLSPALLFGLPFHLWYLRRLEKSDAVITPRPAPDHERVLASIEDHDVTNQFSAIGSVKPGRFRLWTLLFIFRLLDFSTRQIYTRGRLARVGTIHFARWAFLDGKRRLFFGSNYDGSLDSYMDDFINKVAFGLNLVFSNGIGYPRTRFLILGGAKLEQPFKYYLRRHQVPTQVWYKAYPGLTAADLARNSLIREGLQARSMTEMEARRWLALI